jgi:hypothetical protein
MIYNYIHIYLSYKYVCFSWAIVFMWCNRAGVPFVKVMMFFFCHQLLNVWLKNASMSIIGMYNFNLKLNENQ